MISSCEHVRSVRPGVFRRCDKEFTAIALVGDLEPGYFIEIKEFELTCME
jgi:hypothetical protein